MVTMLSFRMSAMLYGEFRDHLLLALARKDEAEGPALFDLKEIAEQVRLPYKRGWIGKAAQEFADRGYVLEAFAIGEGEDGGWSVELKGSGLEQARRRLRQLATILSSSTIQVKSGNGQ
jgi:hypothetical protein